MEICERFLNYVKIDTMSKEESSETPSTAKQFNLAKLLYNELTEMGLETKLSKECVVYGHLKANMEGQPKIGFIAHMDTSPAMSDENVKARIIENYDGKDIVLNEKENIVMSIKDFPDLIKDKDKTLIVTDGTTLLGADDKAGVAIIMDAIQYLLEHPEIKHGDIKVAFTPDEEVGRGTENFDIEYFDCDYAYTADGGLPNSIDYENFNASSVDVLVKGKAIHPGSSKNKLVNSLHLAMEFHSLLPKADDPALTEGYEGFNHLNDLHGDIEDSRMHYIIRNHSILKLRKQENDFRNAADFMNKKYQYNCISLNFKDNYYNMKEALADKMEVIDRAKAAMAKLNITPVSTAIRGGTDGANLTLRGLPCPNLGTGGRNAHGKYEYCVLEDMITMSKLLVEISKGE